MTFLSFLKLLRIRRTLVISAWLSVKVKPNPCMLFDMHLYSLQRLANVAINALAVTSCVERRRRLAVSLVLNFKPLIIFISDKTIQLKNRRKYNLDQQEHGHQ